MPFRSSSRDGFRKRLACYTRPQAVLFQHACVYHWSKLRDWPTNATKPYLLQTAHFFVSHGFLRETKGDGLVRMNSAGQEDQRPAQQDAPSCLTATSHRALDLGHGGLRPGREFCGVIVGADTPRPESRLPVGLKQAERQRAAVSWEASRRAGVKETFRGILQRAVGRRGGFDCQTRGMTT